MSGTSIQLNSGTGGALLTVDFDGTSYAQVVKLGFSVSGTTPVQVEAANPLPVTVTGTAAVSNFPAKQAVSVAGADGTVNIVGTVPVSLTGANGTVNVVGGTVAISNGGGGVAQVDASAFTRGVTSENLAGGVVEALQTGLGTGKASALSLTTGGLLRVDNSNVTQPITGTAAVSNFPAKQAVSVAGADGTVNIVGTVPVSVSGANGTVNIVGTVPVSLTGANGTVNLVAGGTVNVNNIAGTMSLGTNTSVITGTAAVSNFPAKQAVSVAGADGTVNIVGTVPMSVTGANGTVNIVGTVPVSLTGANGTVNVVGTVPVLNVAGTNAMGQVNLSPVSGQGWGTTYSAVGTNTTSNVKTSACTLGGYYIYNSGTSVAYVQMFNTGATGVSLGTTAPKLSIGIPAGGAANLEFANGLLFNSSLSYVVTASRAGTAAPVAEVDVNFWYQ